MRPRDASLPPHWYMMQLGRYDEGDLLRSSGIVWKESGKDRGVVDVTPATRANFPVMQTSPPAFDLRPGLDRTSLGA